uniref:NADH-ubiquinone oxidoreductase chain 2 n=1 Tax=Microbotryum cf. violaceum BFL-2013 TaxID=1288119 RepID=M1GPF2_9BASI|nr:NADH dehydrogenase subunit 2 [Microbotryum cf. violaceum BFL-2013]AGE14615.1 NADH dehydrogenase subunit 2 [Microbotryum cf. violaceum BFL-2013]
MLVTLLLSLLIATPLSSSKISSVQLTRVTSIAFFIAAALSFNGYYVNTLESGVSLYSGLFHVSTVSMAVEMFIFVIGGIILLSPWLSKDEPIAEYSMIVVFSTIGASFLVSSTDLVSLYLAIELQSFAVYILSALYRNNESATAAGLKYFLLGALSSALILLGSSLIYGYTGLTNLDAISNLISVPVSLSPETGMEVQNSVTEGVTLGVVIMSVGFLFKIASAPFHNWAPDVYDGVPTIVTTWIAVMPKISIFVLLLTLHSLTPVMEGFLSVSLMDGQVNVWQALLLVCSLFSLVIGTVVGLAQLKIKRLLAYSTISHVGFMLLGLAVTGQESIDAFLFYLIQYSLTSVNAFFVLLAFGYLISDNSSSPVFFGFCRPFSFSKTKKRDLFFPKRGDKKVRDKMKQALVKKSGAGRGDILFISQLAGQFRQNPILALSMIICLFSMAGIPPLMGFFGKYAVLYSAIHNGYYFISLVAILTSVVSAAYYLRVVRVLYSAEDLAAKPSSPSLSSLHIKKGQVITSSHAYVIAVLTLFIVLFVLQPSLILNSTQLMAMSIYGY